MVTLGDYSEATASNKENRPNNLYDSFKCCECRIDFSNQYSLYDHLFNHIKQPRVILQRYQLPPLKITINRTGKNFEILKSPPIDHNNSTINSNLAAEDSDNNTTVITDSNQQLSKDQQETCIDDSIVDYYQEDDLRRSGQDEENKEIENVEISADEDEQQQQQQQCSGTDDEQQKVENHEEEEEEEEDHHQPTEQHDDDEIAEDEGATIHEDDGSQDFVNNESNLSPTGSDGANRKIVDDIDNVESSDYGSIQECESESPSPPPQQQQPARESGYPKIRIKTTGLLKDSISITEINDDNHSITDTEINADSANHEKDLWNHPAEDPLKLPGTDDGSLMSLFNNNERAKDLGFTTSDSEFISLDRLEERNRNALQLYNPPTNQSPLNSLTGLPMEALAQQVSRLQPSGNGMHQQNVLINIQQFPQAPPHPPPYQPPPPPMYHHPQPPPPPMYHQPYQYQSPNPMYYPPAPGYPQHMPPPPPPHQHAPQMPPLSQPPTGPPPSSIAVSQNQNSQYHRSLVQRQQTSPRHLPPPPPPPPPPQQPSSSNQRMPLVARQNNLNHPRQSMPPSAATARPRVPPGMRPRGSVPGTAIRSMRPKVPLMQQNGPNRNQQPQQQQSPSIKRNSEQPPPVQIKRKKFDVLTPDKDDDDCQVICMQPNNKDGGLPQIQSVQGGTPEPQESNVMHLSDSITLSVRNPQPRAQSPKKSDAKVVANILATRGITVTATPKAKEKNDPKTNNSPSLPSALNLNGVSIIPSAKNNSKSSSNSTESQLPTVDLTDDSPVPRPPPPPKSNNSQPQQHQQQQQKPNSKSNSLPFKCDLCPAQYPNCLGLTKHRQNYHKANNNQGDIGIPLINLKQPGIFQKLASLGIYNYIPLPASGADGTFAFPIIHSRSGNAAGMGANTMLTLGPIRYIPKPAVNGVQNKQNQK